MENLKKAVPPGTRRRDLAERLARAVKRRKSGVDTASEPSPASTTKPPAPRPRNTWDPTPAVDTTSHKRVRPTSVEEEMATLKTSWANHAAEDLDSYLVSGFQDPQVNAQSILARQFFIQKLFPDEDFSELNRAEMDHCVRATKALNQRAEELGVAMGSYLDDEKRAKVAEVVESIRPWQDEFEKKWADELAGRTPAQRLSVLEFACGSANDYRFYDRYGIAQYLDYTGVDLNDKNVANAKRRYPEVDFQVQNVLSLPFEDRSYDYVQIFALLEHMSLAAMEKTVSEACRIADKGLVIDFFSLRERPDNVERPVRSYFWNILSRSEMQGMIEEKFGPVETLRIRDMMVADYDYDRSYNDHAWMFYARRRED